jgi:hypothetical protein
MININLGEYIEHIEEYHKADPYGMTFQHLQILDQTDIELGNVDHRIFLPNQNQDSI